MEVISDLNQLKLSNTAVVLGNFDGIHRGHLTLLDKAKEYAAEHGLKTVFFTFYPHPTHVLAPNPVPLICTDSEKQRVAKEEGMDYYVQFPFTRETASIEAEDFIRDILHDKLGAKAVVVGEDYGFGKGRKGNIEMLQTYSKEYDYAFFPMPKLEENGRVISSTWIREAIGDAQMTLAENLMGRPYFLSGVVIEGAKLGRKIGYPTANIKPDDHKQLPNNGIYATEVELGGVTYYGLTYIGTKPTIEEEDKEIIIETNIVDFDADIYGETLVVKFHKFLRGEEQFESLDQLIDQMKEDERKLRVYYQID